MVNINTVYTTVLYILNKEQRGYVTPTEFNSLATQVQEEIFNSYFPDGNQVNRQNQQNTQNDTEFFNVFKDISYKLYPFEKSVNFTYDNTPSVLGWKYSGNGTVYKLGEIISKFTSTGDYITQLASRKDYEQIIRSKLTAPTIKFPLAYTTDGPDESVLIKVSPKPDNLEVNCLFKPVEPVWNFTTGSLGQYVYNAGTSTNFELDISEQTNIITGILKYAGVIINDPTIIQTAMQEAVKVEQNEKS
jgi:hypothetical protein